MAWSVDHCCDVHRMIYHSLSAIRIYHVYQSFQNYYIIMKIFILLNAFTIWHLTVLVAGYDTCWFFGEDFRKNSFEQHFNSRSSSEYNGYVQAHFDTKGFFTNFLCENPSMICRISNLMSAAIQQKSGDKKLLPLPKIIVIVLDDDVIKCFNRHDAQGLSKPFSRIINHIMTEHERCISAYKEYLPAKCLKEDYPQILWIQAPYHDSFTNNEHRYRFNRSIEEATRFHGQVHTLMLKKVWDPKDSSFFAQEG